MQIITRPPAQCEDAKALLPPERRESLAIDGTDTRGGGSWGVSAVGDKETLTWRDAINTEDLLELGDILQRDLWGERGKRINSSSLTMGGVFDYRFN